MAIKQQGPSHISTTGLKQVQRYFISAHQRLGAALLAALGQPEVYRGPLKKHFKKKDFQSFGEAFFMGLLSLAQSLTHHSQDKAGGMARTFLEKNLDLTIPFEAYQSVLDQLKITFQSLVRKEKGTAPLAKWASTIDHLWMQGTIAISTIYIRACQQLIKEKNTESALLFHTTQSLAIDLNLESLMQKMVFHAGLLLKKNNVFIWMEQSNGIKNNPKKELVLRASNLPADEQALNAVAYGEGVLGQAAALQKPMRDNHYDLKPKNQKPSVLASADKIMVVPIIYAQELLGLMVVSEKKSGRQFNLMDQELLATFAKQIAVVFKNVLLFQEQSKNTEQLEMKNKMLEAQADMILRKTAQLVVLNEVSQNINSSLDLEEVLELLAKQSAQSIGVNRCVVWLLDDNKVGLHAAAAFGVEKEILSVLHLHIDDMRDTVFFTTLSQLKPVQLCTQEDKAVFKKILKNQLTAHNALLVPMILKDEAIGILMVNDTREQHEFLEDEITLISAVANQTVMAVANAQLYKKVMQQAITDGMTGLYNHRFFQLRLSDEYNHAKRYGVDLSVLMMDIDFFKKFNDTYGHMAGDLVLKEIAGLVKSLVRENDIVARYGGEEFVVILPMTNQLGAEVVAERIRASVAECLFYGSIDNPQVGMSVSIGVAGLNGRGPDLAPRDTLIKQADDALYVAKARGRNQVVVYEASMDNN